MGFYLKGIFGQSLDELEHIFAVIESPEHTIKERQKKKVLACDSTSLLFLSLSIHLASKGEYMRHTYSKRAS